MRFAMTTGVLTFALAVAGLLPQSATAQSGNDYASPGGYVGGALALGFENFSGAITTGDFDTGVGFDFWVGGRLMKFLALEGQLQYIPGVKSTSTSREFKPLVYTGNLKGYLPLGRFQPYGLIGIGGMTLYVDSTSPNVDRSDFVARFGAGLEFYITESIAAVAAWNYILGTGSLDGNDFNTLSLGAQFKF
jgi:opacity protein-like surface antigen